jgi:hypothetical protein
MRGSASPPSRNGGFVEITEAEFDTAEAEIAAAIEEEKAHIAEVHGPECCDLCARRLEGIAAALSLILPTIERMGAMFVAIEGVRDTNPTLARLFGIAPNEPKKSRRERRRALTEGSDEEEGGENA